MRGAFEDAWGIIKTDDPDLIRYVQPLIDGLIQFLGLIDHGVIWRDDYLADAAAEYVQSLPDDALELYGSSLDRTGLSIGIEDDERQHNLTEFVTGMTDILDERDRETRDHPLVREQLERVADGRPGMEELARQGDEALGPLHEEVTTFGRRTPDELDVALHPHERAAHDALEAYNDVMGSPVMGEGLEEEDAVHEAYLEALRTLRQHRRQPPEEEQE